MLRRTDVADDELDRVRESARLTWTAPRDGQTVVISLIGPRGGAGGFERVPAPVVADLGPQASAGLVTTVQTLMRAREGGDIVAVQGFAAPRPGRAPLTFVLSVGLAEVAFPEAGDLPADNVKHVRLACGPAVRILRVVETGMGPGAPPLPQFSATFLAPTDHGVLALVFATPHLDGAAPFLELFNAIAESCTVTGR